MSRGADHLDAAARAHGLLERAMNASAASPTTEAGSGKPEPRPRNEEPVRERLELAGVSVELFRSSIDGQLVLQIENDPEDSSGDRHAVPYLRIYLNDGRIYENSPERGEEYGDGE